MSFKKRGSQGQASGSRPPFARPFKLLDKFAGLVVKEGESRGGKVEKPSKDPVVNEEDTEKVAFPEIRSTSLSKEGHYHPEVDLCKDLSVSNSPVCVS